MTKLAEMTDMTENYETQAITEVGKIYIKNFVKSLNRIPGEGQIKLCAFYIRFTDSIKLSFFSMTMMISKLVFYVLRAYT